MKTKKNGWGFCLENPQLGHSSSEDPMILWSRATECNFYGLSSADHQIGGLWIETVNQEEYLHQLSKDSQLIAGRQEQSSVHKSEGGLQPSQEDVFEYRLQWQALDECDQGREGVSRGVNRDGGRR